MYVRNSRKMAKLKNTVNLSKIIFFIIIILHAHPQYVCKTLAIEWDVQHYEPRREKTGLRGFRPGPTQTRLYSHRSRLEA